MATKEPPVFELEPRRKKILAPCIVRTSSLVISQSHTHQKRELSSEAYAKLPTLELLHRARGLPMLMALDKANAHLYLDELGLISLNLENRGMSTIQERDFAEAAAKAHFHYFKNVHDYPKLAANFGAEGAKLIMELHQDLARVMDTFSLPDKQERIRKKTQELDDLFERRWVSKE